MNKQPVDTLEFEMEFLESVYAKDKKDTQIIELLAGIYTQSGRIDEGLRLDRRHVRLEPENPTAHYNLACSLALKSRFRDAISSLKTSLLLGFHDYEWMKKDPDLEPIRQHEKFIELLEEFEIKS